MLRIVKGKQAPDPETTVCFYREMTKWGDFSPPGHQSESRVSLPGGAWQQCQVQNQEVDSHHMVPVSFLGIKNAKDYKDTAFPNIFLNFSHLT